MPIHKIRLYYSVTGSDQFHQWIEQWHDSVNTETSDLITNEIPNSTISRINIDAEYYGVTFTYPLSENATEVLEQPYQKLVEYCDWSKVGYHECDDVADNTVNSDCNYPEDKIYRDDDVPVYVPSLN
jgi:hypothetical protein